ncbi:hypothetical protein BLA29_009447, partial [Euroglyphus maynei]
TPTTSNNSTNVDDSRVIQPSTKRLRRSYKKKTLISVGNSSNTTKSRKSNDGSSSLNNNDNDTSQKSESESNRYPNPTVMQASILNANIEGVYCEEKLVSKPDGSQEEFIKIYAPEPVDPKKERFLDDWNQYGQIRFFDVANYRPVLPKILTDFIAKVETSDKDAISTKEFDQMKDLLGVTIFQDLQHYFIWRLPTRFLHTVCDRIIQMYPILDDGSPTKTVFME